MRRRTCGSKAENWCDGAQTPPPSGGHRLSPPEPVFGGPTRLPEAVVNLMSGTTMHTQSHGGHRHIALILGVVAALFAGAALADPPTRVARVGYVNGSVSF